MESKTCAYYSNIHVAYELGCDILLCFYHLSVVTIIVIRCNNISNALDELYDLVPKPIPDGFIHFIHNK